MSGNENNTPGLFEDIGTLNAFRMHKAAEYFNVAAAKAASPDIAREDRDIADTIEKAALVQERLENVLAGKLERTAEQIAEDDTLLDKFYTWARKAQKSGEMKNINDYQASKIAEFADAQPEIWKRLAQTTDYPFIEKAKRYLDLNPEF